MKPLRRVVVQREQALAHPKPPVILRAQFLLNDLDARALGEPLRRVGKIYVFIQLDEFENRPTNAAAKAFKDLF